MFDSITGSGRNPDNIDFSATRLDEELDTIKPVQDEVLRGELDKIQATTQRIASGGDIDDTIEQVRELKESIYSDYLNKNNVGRAAKNELNVNERSLNGIEAAKDMIQETQGFLKKLKKQQYTPLWDDLKQALQWYQDRLDAYEDILRESTELTQRYVADNMEEASFLQEKYEEILRVADELQTVNNTSETLESLHKYIRQKSRELESFRLESFRATNAKTISGVNVFLGAILSQANEDPVWSGIFAVSAGVFAADLGYQLFIQGERIADGQPLKTHVEDALSTINPS